MPKLKNVTKAELDQANSEAETALFSARDIQSRMEQGYCDEIKEPVAVARSFLSASRALADLGAAILTKAALQEQKAELERLHGLKRDKDPHGLKSETR